jgi:hypothetical protein
MPNNEERYATAVELKRDINKRQPIPVVRAAGVVQPPVEPKRTAQDLLGERRYTVSELRRETDPTARELLQWSIDQIDHELHALTGRDVISEAFEATRAVVADLEAERDARVEPMTDRDWSPAQHVRAA